VRKLLIIAICFNSHFAFAAPIKSETMRIPGMKDESQLMKEAYQDSDEQAIQPLSQRGEVFVSAASFVDVLEMRKKRRVGAGMSIAGPLGAYGAQVELSFSPDDAVIVGVGGGDPYSSYLFSWKHLFSEQNLAPFTSLGLSHWTSGRGNGPISETNPGVLGRRYLSALEKSTGKFAKTFIAPSMGLQYSITSGNALGWSFFTEIVFLMEISNISPHITGGVGAAYFF
jgi:hypothetical protein